MRVRRAPIDLLTRLAGNIDWRELYIYTENALKALENVQEELELDAVTPLPGYGITRFAFGSKASRLARSPSF